MIWFAARFSGDPVFGLVDADFPRALTNRYNGMTFDPTPTSHLASLPAFHMAGWKILAANLIRSLPVDFVFWDEER